MSKVIEKFDKRGNLIYKFFPQYDFKEWREYDKNNNIIYWRNSCGNEAWREYDKNNNIIYYKDSEGNEIWYKYDKSGRLILCKCFYTDGDKWFKYNYPGSNIAEITKQEYSRIEFKEQEFEFLNRGLISRFRLMEL